MMMDRAKSVSRVTGIACSYSGLVLQVIALATSGWIGYDDGTDNGLLQEGLWISCYCQDLSPVPDRIKTARATLVLGAALLLVSACISTVREKTNWDTGCIWAVCSIDIVACVLISIGIGTFRSYMTNDSEYDSSTGYSFNATIIGLLAALMTTVFHLILGYQVCRPKAADCPREI